MLWHIENSETHILASVHIMDAPFRLSPQADVVYSRSNRVAFESDFTNQPDITRFFLPADCPLSAQLTPQLVDATLKRMQETGLAWDKIQRFPPWLVGLTLVMLFAARKGITEANGVDRKLLERAAKDQRQIVTLEAQDAALDAFALAPPNEQIFILSYIAEETDTCLEELSGFVSAWRDGLEKPFEDALERRLDRAPKLFDALVRKRNQAWIPRLAAMADEKIPTLVCVGVLHCVGPIGLPTLLTELGRPVSRVD